MLQWCQVTAGPRWQRPTDSDCHPAQSEDCSDFMVASGRHGDIWGMHSRGSLSCNKHQKDIKLPEYRKEPLWAHKGCWERTQDSCRAGISLMRRPPWGCFGIKWEQQKRWKNLQGNGKSWLSPLHSASRALDRLVSPSAASFSFLFSFFPLIQILYPSTEHYLGFPSTVLFCMFYFVCISLFRMGLHSYLPTPATVHSVNTFGAPRVCECWGFGGKLHFLRSCGLQVPQRKEECAHEML